MAEAAEAAAKGFLEVGGLCDAVRLMASPLNNFWKKLGFLQGKSKIFKIGLILYIVLAVFHEFGLTFLLHNGFFLLLKMSKNVF